MLTPAEVGIRKMASAVTQINSKLVWFAGTTGEVLFSAAELLEILEWTIPHLWRAKFDATGYVSTEHNKVRLIAESQQIKYSESHGSVNVVTALLQFSTENAKRGLHAWLQPPRRHHSQRQRPQPPLLLKVTWTQKRAFKSLNRGRRIR